MARPSKEIYLPAWVVAKMPLLVGKLRGRGLSFSSEILPSVLELFKKHGLDVPKEPVKSKS